MTLQRCIVLAGSSLLRGGRTCRLDLPFELDRLQRRFIDGDRQVALDGTDKPSSIAGLEDATNELAGECRIVDLNLPL